MKTEALAGTLSRTNTDGSGVAIWTLAWRTPSIALIEAASSMATAFFSRAASTARDRPSGMSPTGSSGVADLGNPCPASRMRAAATSVLATSTLPLSGLMRVV